jgi:ABC-2 type transport system permease protein
MRRALLTNASFAELMPNIVALLIFSAVLVPASLYIFRRAVHRAKVDGSLAHF